MLPQPATDPQRPASVIVEARVQMKNRNAQNAPVKQVAMKPYTTSPTVWRAPEGSQPYAIANPPPSRAMAPTSNKRDGWAAKNRTPSFVMKKS